MISPTCLEGALLSALNFVRRAASLARLNKQEAELVVPFAPGWAEITLPDWSTEIVTTTFPSSLQSYSGIGLVSALRFPKR